MKVKPPRKRLLDEAEYTGRQLGLVVSVFSCGMGQWTIDVRRKGQTQHGMPLTQFYTGRENVALAYLAGLLAGAQLPKEGE